MFDPSDPTSTLPDRPEAPERHPVDAWANTTRVELVELWQAAYGRPPPPGISSRLLTYAAAYNEQVRSAGGLSPAARRKLKKIVAGTTKRSPNGDTSSGIRSTTKRRSVPPGTRLVREWQGAVHSVEVLGAGYLYAGVVYGSLSEIARSITGARWSGPRFFGLT